jgi:hypothetical protein
MARYVFLALGDCSDPSREAEMNKFYNEVHVPDVLSVPGVISATRYENVDPEGNKRPKFLAVFEIEPDDINKFDQNFTDIMMKVKAAGRDTDCIIPDRSVPLKKPYFRQIMPTKYASKSKKTEKDQ